jgi:hypothetical protein
MLCASSPESRRALLRALGDQVVKASYVNHGQLRFCVAHGLCQGARFGRAIAPMSRIIDE